MRFRNMCAYHLLRLFFNSLWAGQVFHLHPRRGTWNKWWCMINHGGLNRVLKTGLTLVRNWAYIDQHVVKFSIYHLINKCKAVVTFGITRKMPKAKQRCDVAYVDFVGPTTQRTLSISFIEDQNSCNTFKCWLRQLNEIAQASEFKRWNDTSTSD